MKITQRRRGRRRLTHLTRLHNDARL